MRFAMQNAKKRNANSSNRTERLHIYISCILSRNEKIKLYLFSSFIEEKCTRNNFVTSFVRSVKNLIFSFYSDIIRLPHYSSYTLHFQKSKNKIILLSNSVIHKRENLLAKRNGNVRNSRANFERRIGKQLIRKRRPHIKKTGTLTIFRQFVRSDVENRTGTKKYIIDILLECTT